MKYSQHSQSIIVAGFLGRSNSYISTDIQIRSPILCIIVLISRGSNDLWPNRYDADVATLPSGFLINDHLSRVWCQSRLSDEKGDKDCVHMSCNTPYDLKKISARRTSEGFLTNQDPCYLLLISLIISRFMEIMEYKSYVFLMFDW